MNRHSPPSIILIVVFVFGMTTLCYSQDTESFTLPSTSTFDFHYNLSPHPALPEGIGEEWMDPTWGAFWIFSDGHFHAIKDNGRFQISKTVVYPGFTTASGGSYDVTTYLTKIYTDTEPPPDDFVISPGNGGNGTEVTHFTNFIPTGRHLALDVNHEPKLGTDLVFVNSYDFEEYDGNGRVYFFFDSFIKETGEIVKAPASAFFHERSHFPYYLDSIGLDAPRNDMNLFDNEHSGTNFESEFGQVLMFNFGEGQWAQNGIESRLFHALETREYAEYPSGSKFNFMTIVTSSSRGNAMDLSSRSDTVRLQKLLGQNFALGTLGSGDFPDNVIVDIVDTTLLLTGNHDPNRLCFLEACGCEKRSAYKTMPIQARLSLTICNDGDGPVYNMTVNFIDVLGKYAGLHIESIKGIGGNYYADHGTPFSHTADPFVSDYSLVLPVDNVDNLTIPGVAGTYTGPKCIEIIFTVDTDEQGLEKLITDQGAIQADIIFEPNPPVPAYSEYCRDPICCGTKRGNLHDTAKSIIADAKECNEHCKTKELDLGKFFRNEWSSLLIILILLIWLIASLLRYRRERRGDEREERPNNDPVEKPQVDPVEKPQDDQREDDKDTSGKGKEESPRKENDDDSREDNYPKAK